jgi:predicted Zn finger-like uncharacterized protein
MNVSCPECQSVFRVDPARVPGPGIRARCSVCGGIIPITSARSWTDDFATPHDAASLTSTTPRAGAVAAAAAATIDRAVESRPGAAAIGGARLTPPVGVPRSPTPARVPPFAPGRRPTPPASPAVPSAPTAAAQPRSAPPVPVSQPAPSAPAAATPMAGPPQPRQAPPAPVGPPRAPEVPIGSPIARTAPVASAPTPSVAPMPSARPPASSNESAGGAARPDAVASTPSKAPINPFLANDPNQKAKRLARALVSDMVAYHPQKRDEGMRAGTLKQLFREEIKKSYEEYVEQIGKEFAESTSHFQDALNDVLAGGKKVF